MESKELMIGNWVQYHGGYREILSVNIYGIVCIDNGTDDYMQTTNQDIEPIPITPEILEMAGFEKDESGDVFCSLDFDVCLAFNEHQQCTILQDGEPVLIMLHIKYLHQLQNLYYALTGTHLKIELK